MLTESLEEVVEGTFSCPKTAQVAASITANPISGLRIRFPLPVQPARCLRLGLKYGRELESAKCTVMRHEKARKKFRLGQMGRGWARSNRKWRVAVGRRERPKSTVRNHPARNAGWSRVGCATG